MSSASRAQQERGERGGGNRSWGLSVPTRHYAHPVASNGQLNGNGRKRQDKPSGKLELTWTNKGKALLSHEDGSYEWVEKRDRRVAEVRLLHDAGHVGAVGPDAQ